MNILCVFGSRSITDPEVVSASIDNGIKDFGLSAKDIDLMLDGDAPGVDRLGRGWAIAHDIRWTAFPAAWRDLSAPGAVIREGPYGKYNANAGKDRNIKMAHEATHFIGIRAAGKSNGTDHMIRVVKGLGKPLSIQFAP